MVEEIRFPVLVARMLDDELVFRPAPPGDVDASGNARVKLPRTVCDVRATVAEIALAVRGLRSGVLPAGTVAAVLRAAHADPDPDHLPDATIEPDSPRSGGPLAPLPGAAGPLPDSAWWARMEADHELDNLALLAVRLVDRAQQALLVAEPLTEITFRLTAEAKLVLATGWAALSTRGMFPLPPRGAGRLGDLDAMPHGAMHFVSASDLDSGYLYTMGVATSPQAQALGTMDTTFGLDGELIVPGQAVSPIPPFLALATRLFAASVPTSSNISEEEQSIPMRNFPHPTGIDDLAPVRGGRYKPPVRPRDTQEAVTDLRMQLLRATRARAGARPTELAGPPPARPDAPDIGAAFDVTDLSPRQIEAALTPVLADPVLAEHRREITLYLDVEAQSKDRVDVVCGVVDAAARLGLRYVAVADDVEDSWLPGLLEYLEPDELTAIADHADAARVVVVDGRPVDPIYTAATAAQRIQSVYSTLSVDILKMGMWLCLDATTARKVWQEITSNPHIPARMLLMPIGIVEPWSAFVDNRDPDRTARPVTDPYDKIKFMIEEAAYLGIPSLLTDTRHKDVWVLLGQRGAGDSRHRREQFITDPATGETIGRRPGSAIPLLTWDQFMDCERRARAAGILLGQAGSIESDQAFRLISEVTYDAARQGGNPATAIWTAETERSLHLGGAADSVPGDLHRERSARVSAFLAVVNRGYESHATLDGWLRFLADTGGGDNALRAELDNLRDRLATSLAACLDSQVHEPSRYQRRWDTFREEYLRYHRLIRDNFVRIRADVATAWAARGNRRPAAGGLPPTGVAPAIGVAAEARHG